MGSIHNFPGYTYRLDCFTGVVSLIAVDRMPDYHVLITQSHLSVKLVAAAVVNIDVSIIECVFKRPSQQFSQMMTCT